MLVLCLYVENGDAKVDAGFSTSALRGMVSSWWMTWKDLPSFNLQSVNLPLVISV